MRQVNPAFSSVIGRVKFMERYGLSPHQAAALVLARRLLGCSKRIPRRRVYPVGNGVQAAFTAPARKRVKHVWTYGAAARLRSRLQEWLTLVCNIVNHFYNGWGSSTVLISLTLPPVALP